jgi:hypothetical protein
MQHSKLHYSLGIVALAMLVQGCSTSNLRSDYDPWGSYGYGTETHVSQYTEGTFNIDLVDNARGQLVWEAVGKGRVSQKDLENLREGVMKGVPKYFARYPFEAGNPDPVTPEK